MIQQNTQYDLLRDNGQRGREDRSQESMNRKIHTEGLKSHGNVDSNQFALFRGQRFDFILDASFHPRIVFYIFETHSRDTEILQWVYMPDDVPNHRAAVQLFFFLTGCWCGSMFQSDLMPTFVDYLNRAG